MINYPSSHHQLLGLSIQHKSHTICRGDRSKVAQVNIHLFHKFLGWAHFDFQYTSQRDHIMKDFTHCLSVELMLMRCYGLVLFLQHLQLLQELYITRMMLSVMMTLLYFRHQLVCYSEVPLINVDTITSNSLEPKFLELDSNSILN